MDPLRYATFRWLITGRTINAFGSAFAPIAVAFAVLDLTGSASDLGLVVGVRTLFNAAFLLVGGVLADRMPKHLLMVGSALVAAASQGVAAALLLTHTANVTLLLVVAAVNGAVAAMSMPATASILPQTVPRQVRQQANAINRIFFNGAAVLGAPIAGVVVAAIGAGWGIVVDASTFLLGAVCFTFMRVRKEITSDRSNIFSNYVRAGRSSGRGNGFGSR